MAETEKWPEGVQRISQDVLDHLGVHEKTHRLYWDGKELVTRTGFFLGTPERWIGGIAASAAAVTALVNVIRLLAGK